MKSKEYKKSSYQIINYYKYARYKCIKCGAEQLVYTDEFCYYPGCSGEIVCKISTNCKHRKNFQCSSCKNSKCSINNHTNHESLIECLNKKCPYADYNNDLKNTKEVGMFFLNILNDRYKHTCINFDEKDFDQNEKMIIKNEYIDRFSNYPDCNRLILNDDPNLNFDSYLKFYCNEYNRLIKNQFVKKITVKDLFGYYSYELSFDNKNSISVILGPNGLGKTTVFKLLESFLVDNINDSYDAWGKYDDFNSINMKDKIYNIIFTNYSMFRVDFSDGSSIEATRKSQSIDPTLELIMKKDNKEHNKDWPIPENEITVNINYYGFGFSEIAPVTLFEFSYGNDYSNVGTSLYDSEKNFKRHLYNVNRAFPIINEYKKFIFINVNRINDMNLLKNKIEVLLKSNNKNKNPNDFKDIFDKANAPYIIDDFKIKYNQLKYKIQNAYIEYYRYIRMYSIFETLEEWHDLDNKPFDLVAKTFGADEESFRQVYTMFNLKDEFSDEANNNKDDLDYLIKQKAKLHSHGNIAVDPISEFKKLIDEGYKFINKVELLNNYFTEFYLNFDKAKKGIVFIPKGDLLYIKNKQHNDLPINILSSGETNLLTIIYDLLFCVDTGSIILIDEPEVSLHIAWQSQLLDIIYDLIGERDIQVIIASHSPFITAGKSNLLVKRKSINKVGK